MSRTDKEGVIIRESVIAEKNAFQMTTLTLGGSLTIADSAPPVQFIINNGSARNWILPLGNRIGAWFLLVNRSATAVSGTVLDSTSTTTVATVAQNKSVLVVSNGDGSITSWGALLSA